MTPKEKAKELVIKYSRILPMNQTTLLDCKNCALVAVNTILSTCIDEEEQYRAYKYWQEVKQEIEKI